MLDITLVTCNYNTPQALELLLKSWANTNLEVTNKCLVMEHSTNDESIPFLESNNIRYVRNKGCVHYKGVEASFYLVNTRYMLLVDSDVVFHKSIFEHINRYINDEIHLAGRVEGDRGGFLLYKRVHPWFCFIDLGFILNNSIHFTDMKRIHLTRSEGFFKNVPLNKSDGVRKYDVGSTFLEDVLKAHGRVLNHNIENEYFTHFEGMSWHRNTGDAEYLKVAEDRQIRFNKEYEINNEIDIKGVLNG